MARLRDVRRKVAVSVRLDPQVLDWLQSSGERHLTGIKGRPSWAPWRGSSAAGSGRKEVVGLDSGLPQDGTQRTLRQIAWMVREGRIAICRRIEPDFVATRQTRNLSPATCGLLPNSEIPPGGPP